MTPEEARIQALRQALQSSQIAQQSSPVTNSNTPVIDGRELKVGDIFAAKVIDSDNFFAGDVGKIKELGDPESLRFKVDSIDSDGNVNSTAWRDGKQLLTDIDGYMGATVKLYRVDDVKKKPDKKFLQSIVISDEVREEILCALSQIKYQKKIFDTWGLEDVIEKGRGITMFFYGPPGTGKTMMGQAIATYMGQQLRIIQSGDVQSSQPGQTERNIKAFFDAASKENNVLLFDECDSLIYDRNAVGMILGAEINALLSALELYEGVAIFTTNRLGIMDQAFERRVSAKIEFPFPDEKARRKIWGRLLPEKFPLASNVDLDQLAKFHLSGGNIKNVVLNTARLAAYRRKRKVDADCFATTIRREIKSSKEFEESRKKNRPQRMGPGIGTGVAVDKAADKVADITSSTGAGV